MEEEAKSEDAIARDVLDRAGAGEALREALASAQLAALPGALDALVEFLEGPLLDALVGRVHPVTARRLVDEILERAPRRPASGMRVRAEPVTAPTVPPPAMEGASEAYDALATGEVHTRATPTWGLRRTGDGEIVLPTVWLIVSTEAALLELARRDAPADTKVIAISSLAALESALARSDGASLCVVLDAGAPSVPLGGAVSAIGLHPASRVLVWRVDDPQRRRWLDAVPTSRTWLPCEAEVTPAEIVQLLGA